MRLDLFLPHLRTGGIETGLVRLAPELVDRDLSVRFVLQDGTGELRQNIPAGIEVIALNRGGMWRSARAYAALLRDSPCDIVYSATNALNVAQLLAGRLLGAQAPRCVVGEHIPLQAFLATRKQPWMRRMIMRATYPAATALVAPTQNILDEHVTLIGTRCPPGTVLPNPVIRALTPAPALPKRARHFVSLGRLSPEKGFDLALQMMAAYRAHDPQARLTIYGEGPERAALEALRDQLGLSDMVALPGRTNDVARALSQADLFLCSSHVEGFGNAIVEAQAAGVPVLSVDCPFGPRILLQDGAAGCLIDSRDPDRLAQALHSFASDPEARKTAQTKAQDIAGRYTITASADAHATFFKDLMG